MVHFKTIELKYRICLVTSLPGEWEKAGTRRHSAMKTGKVWCQMKRFILKKLIFQKTGNKIAQFYNVFYYFFENIYFRTMLTRPNDR